MIKVQSKKKLMNVILGAVLLILGLINVNIALMILSIVLITSGILNNSYFFIVTMVLGFLILLGTLSLVLINQNISPIFFELLIYSVGIFMIGIIFYIQNIIGFKLGEEKDI